MSNVHVPVIQLPNGVQMPRLMFGVYQIQDPKLCQKAVEDALECGYRAIDTAASYGNEAAVGAAIRTSGLKREELFITTKLWVEDASEVGAQKAVNRSLELLGLDHLDLYLLHQPFGDIWGAWRTMTRLYKEGILRAIGVSNFYPDRITEFVLANEIAPMVNQIEINPYFQQRDAIENMDSLGVVAEAWAPFAEGRNVLFDNPVLKGIAQKHSKTVAQVVLAMVLNLGAVAISKSVRKERMCENLSAASVILDDEDMRAIAMLDTGKSQFFSHRDPQMVRWFYGRHIEH